jgi:5-methylcytosine-specific restriction endonuclease McrA
MMWRIGTKAEADPLLEKHHYLGPIKSGAFSAIVVGVDDGRVVAAQVWRRPTSRRLPSDGSWLELSRWCLTPEAGPNAGSRQHAAAVKLLKSRVVTTLVSYSDPSQGHTGSLYRACNWRWAPTWQRLRPPPTGAGNWGTDQVQHVKDRWIFPVSKDLRRDHLLSIKDNGAIRYWMKSASEAERAMALRSLAPDLVKAVTS